MSTNNLNRKIIWQKIGHFGGELLLDLITYIGSIVTILSVYFINNPFDGNDIKDLLIIGFSLVVFITWVSKSYNKLTNQTQISLQRSDFFEYVSNEKEKATTSVINIAGDVSWLIEEKQTFKDLIDSKPNLEIQIFYEKEKVQCNKKILRTIQEYTEFGVKMIEYPFSNIPHLKALLIDHNSDDTKFLVFKKRDSNYIINTFRNDDIALNYASAFIDSINSFHSYKVKKNNNKQLVIGISGLNNIGKSTLISYLKHHYKEKIDFIPDTFKHESKSSFEAAALALCHQLVLYFEKREKSNAQLILFDRTPIDNLAFLYTKLESNSAYKEYTHSISDRVFEFINHFDFIALLKPPKQNFKYTSTTHLDSNSRKKVKKRIEILYNECHANVYTYHTALESENYKPRLKDICQDIIKRIDKDVIAN